MLVYDITRRSSFESLDTWLKRIRDSVSNDYKVVLIGNKVDLSRERSVSLLEAQDFAKKNDFQFFETSAKTNQDQCVEKAIKAFLQRATEDLIDKEKKELIKLLKNQKSRLKKLDPEILNKTSCC